MERKHLEPPLALVKKTLNIEADTLWIMVIFSLCISLLSLVIPIAVQTVVNTLAFSRYLQPIVVLVVIVVFCLLFAGILRICQLYVLESKQQEIFVRVAYQFSNLLKRLDIGSIANHRGPELVNRFFEVVPLQKNISLLLVYGIEIIIQSLTSCILLAFYHPYLLALVIIIVVMTTLSILLPYRKALGFAYDESDHKHETATWLEEYFHSKTLHKFSNAANFTHNKVDDALCKYITARKSHFKHILTHFVGFYASYVTANALLLGLGGYLVINQRLTLGQLVASEIILNILMSSFLRFSYSLKELYDLAASSRKIDSITQFNYDKDISEVTETNKRFFREHLSAKPYIRLENVSLHKDDASVINPVSYTFKGGEISAIFGPPQSGKSALIETILGFTKATTGQVFINEMAICEDNLTLLREATFFMKDNDFVLGSILENLTLSNPDFNTEKLHEILIAFELFEKLTKLEDGLDTGMLSVSNALCQETLFKLIMVRAIISNPKVIFIDGYLDKYRFELIKNSLALLQQFLDKPTIILSTAKEDIANLATETLTLSLS